MDVEKAIQAPATRMGLVKARQSFIENKLSSGSLSSLAKDGGSGGGLKKSKNKSLTSLEDFASDKKDVSSNVVGRANRRRTRAAKLDTPLAPLPDRRGERNSSSSLHALLQRSTSHSETAESSVKRNATFGSSANGNKNGNFQRASTTSSILLNKIHKLKTPVTVKDISSPEDNTPAVNINTARRSLRANIGRNSLLPAPNKVKDISSTENNTPVVNINTARRSLRGNIGRNSLSPAPNKVTNLGTVTNFQHVKKSNILRTTSQTDGGGAKSTNKNASFGRSNTTGNTAPVRRGSVGNLAAMFSQGSSNHEPSSSAGFKRSNITSANERSKSLVGLSSLSRSTTHPQDKDKNPAIKRLWGSIRVDAKPNPAAGDDTGNKMDESATSQMSDANSIISQGLVGTRRYEMAKRLSLDEIVSMPKAVPADFKRQDSFASLSSAFGDLGDLSDSEEPEEEDDQATKEDIAARAIQKFFSYACKLLTSCREEEAALKKELEDVTRRRHEELEDTKRFLEIEKQQAFLQIQQEICNDGDAQDEEEITLQAKCDLNQQQIEVLKKEITKQKKDQTRLKTATHLITQENKEISTKFLLNTSKFKHLESRLKTAKEQMAPWKAVHKRYELSVSRAQEKVDRAVKKAENLKSSCRDMSRCIRNMMKLVATRVEAGDVELVANLARTCTATVESVVGENWLERDTATSTQQMTKDIGQSPAENASIVDNSMPGTSVSQGRIGGRSESERDLNIGKEEWQTIKKDIKRRRSRSKSMRRKLSDPNLMLSLEDEAVGDDKKAKLAEVRRRRSSSQKLLRNGSAPDLNLLGKEKKTKKKGLKGGVRRVKSSSSARKSLLGQSPESLEGSGMENAVW